MSRDTVLILTVVAVVSGVIIVVSGKDAAIILMVRCWKKSYVLNVNSVHY